MKITANEDGTNTIVYGRDMEDICSLCKRPFKDHETLKY